MERILGIDYGDARTGVAISDLLGLTAQPLETINNAGDDDMLVERLVGLIKEHGVRRIVFGYPKNMNGTLGPRVEKTEALISKLQEAMTETMHEAQQDTHPVTSGESTEPQNSTLEIIRRDERLTSVIAGQVMRDMGIKKKKKVQHVDKIAALQILQGYLDSGSGSL